MNFGELRGRRVERGVGWNGGFWSPSFGDMSSFWFSGGMCRRDAAAEDRSWRVASFGRVRGCGVPWWWMVRAMVGDGGSSMAFGST